MASGDQNAGSGVEGGEGGDKKEDSSTPEEAEITMESSESEVEDGNGVTTVIVSPTPMKDVEVVDDEAEDDEATDDELPLFKYSRLRGSLHRVRNTLAAPCRTTALGRVVLDLGALSMSSSAASAATPSAGGPSSGSSSSTTTTTVAMTAKLAREFRSHFPTMKPRFEVLALGFAIPRSGGRAAGGGGSIQLVDSRTGNEVVGTGILAVAAAGQTPPRNSKGEAGVVGLSFDSTGTQLAAIGTNGDAVIFEFKYGLAPSSSVKSTSRNGGQSNSPGFNPFGGAFGGDAAAGGSAPGGDNPLASFFISQFGNPHAGGGATAATTPAADSPPPVLSVTTAVTASRFNYSRSSGYNSPPTCLVIDPSYKRRREKALLVGFSDGRLILTKRGKLFSRRNDSVLYRGASIEAVVWRGSLVAWADASGIMLYDVETDSRIAHVDRPSGARPTLYPTVSEMRPSLLFERSDSLLIAWGDCVMSMSITKPPSSSSQQKQREAPTLGAGANPSGQPQAVRRRTVECSMAWELDCVACAVAPVDADHVAVLGLVPVGTNDEEGGDGGGGGVDEAGGGSVALQESSSANLIELQVIDRQDGGVTSSDALPLLRRSDEAASRREPDAATEYAMLSSFGTPRMEDEIEAGEHVEEEVATAPATLDDFDFALFGGGGGGGGANGATAAAASADADESQTEASTNTTRQFVDPHIKWSIRSVIDIDNHDVDDGDASGATDAKKDAVVLNGDDYAFLIHPRKVNPLPGTSRPREPPIFVISSRQDAVLVKTRDTDDAITHAKSQGRHALALQRALRGRRLMRKHDLNRLINDYMDSLLKSPSLTMDRLQLAARVTPSLFGNHVSSWTDWMSEFCKIPGAVFVLREYLPVRDPKLPPPFYLSALETMLTEVQNIRENQGRDEAKQNVGENAGILFLNALRAWGPTHSLRERIQLHRYYLDRPQWRSQSHDVVGDPALVQLEKDLYNRMKQTASGYLQAVPAPSSSRDPRPKGGVAFKLDDGMSGGGPGADALYNLVDLSDLLDGRLTVASPSGVPETDALAMTTTTATESTMLLEAAAELFFMIRSYDACLRYFLCIGDLQASAPGALAAMEDVAIRCVNAKIKSSNDGRRRKFQHVLAMIEKHQLQSCLRDESFLQAEYPLGSDKGDRQRQSPILALIFLVGLDLSSQFLVEHCILAQPRSEKSTKKDQEQYGDNLPIDLVAGQLRSRPKLLHWYLCQIFVHRPEHYVRFPHTALPPPTIMELHREHTDLHIRYAAVDRRADSDRELADLPAYDEEDFESPLMAFLKATLPYGAIRPDDVRHTLMERRKEKPKDSYLFARELAFVIQEYGTVGRSEQDARTVLDLYLEGAKSLPLAVNYAEQHPSHSAMLWESLVSYCLEKGKKEEDAAGGVDGTLFGALLEVAARYGADLASLVARIPEGMRIEGLRPKLVAAVTDYRLKLRIHESANDVLNRDKVSLLRELTHRSRRAFHVIPPPLPKMTAMAPTAYLPSPPRPPPAVAAVKASAEGKPVEVKKQDLTIETNPFDDEEDYEDAKEDEDEEDILVRKRREKLAKSRGKRTSGVQTPKSAVTLRGVRM